ncbi:hypothetical protein E2562_037168 [Oryza meyeriana var. granulata]|uniref:DUF834 domain-containing protein n=1 Tax=Oryza meyeriana var. granulata TaxID=110450 RepID=A0A6G1DAR2_9ORYZ|nr:hypothetical protein E2562_037168 [Oryza meyeriana var. granulata]
MGEIDGGGELGLRPLGVAQSELARAAGGKEVTALLAAAAAAQGTSNRRLRQGWQRVCSMGGEGMGEIDGGGKLGLGPLGVAQSDREAVAAAVKKLRLNDALANVVPDFDLAGHGHRPSTSAAEPSASHSHADDVVVVVAVARSDPEPEAVTLRAASQDRTAASRASGRRRAEDEADHEPACGHH